MASDDTEKSTEQDETAFDVISPAKRKKLQTYFQYGTEKRETGDWDYAHSMFAQCVVGDPANIVYLEALLENLTNKFHDKKKKAKVRSSRGPFKKALAAEQWKECLKLGLELLSENPWDIPTLRALAEAAAARRPSDERFSEIELRFLRGALDSDPKNIEVNKHCAESLAAIGQYDQAIACLHRIEELVSNKSEIQKQISKLTMAKTARATGILEDDLTKPTPTAKPAAKPSSTAKAEPALDLSTVAGLEQAIAKDPTTIKHYLDLADLQTRQEDLKGAEATLRRALSASGNEIKVREKLEDTQMRRAREQLTTAQLQAKAEPSEKAQQLVDKLKQELNRLELSVYNSRVERYPEEKVHQYELAVRLKRGGSYKEAAKHFEATIDAEGYEAASAVQQGECLQQLRKYQEALTRYMQARKWAESTSKPDILKLSLYRGGILAGGLKSWDQARALFEELTSLEPGYRDAQARLDKLKSIQDT